MAKTTKKDSLDSLYLIDFLQVKEFFLYNICHIIKVVLCVCSCMYTQKVIKKPWCSVGLLEKCLYFLLSLYWNRQYRTPFFCRSHGYDIKTRAFLLWVVTLIPPIFALKLFTLHIQMIGLSGWKIHDPRIRGFTDAKFLPHLIELNLFTWLFTVSFRNK